MVKKYGLYIIGCLLLISNAQAGILQKLVPERQQESKRNQIEENQIRCIKAVHQLVRNELSRDNTDKILNVLDQCTQAGLFENQLALFQIAEKYDNTYTSETADNYIHIEGNLMSQVYNMLQQEQNQFVSSVMEKIEAQQQKAESKSGNNTSTTIIK